MRVIIGLLALLLLVTAVSAGNSSNAAMENAGKSIEQQPPVQTEDPSQPVVPTQSGPIIVPTEALPVATVQESTAPQQQSIPTDPLTGVYCASSSALIRINGFDAPTPAGGCVCVKAYGVHTLETGPDLYAGTDESAIANFSSSPQQCLNGVTTYNWSAGVFDAGTYQQNPNGEPITQPGETIAPAVDESLNMIVDARADLESLAINTIGVGRPDGWSGSLEITDPTLPLLVRFDLELLADELLGIGVRPAGWFGSVASTPYALVRDVRHDLELLADEHLGKGSRPSGWAGTKGKTLITCNRSTQALVDLLERGGVYVLTVLPTDPDFCAKAEASASAFAETNLLSNPADSPIFSSRVTAGGAGATTIDTEFAVAFLDKGAALSVGVIPQGEAIKPVGRSISQFSRMTLVEGAEFLVFVDYRDTTLTEEQFEVLPDAGSYSKSPFCSAAWCGD